MNKRDFITLLGGAAAAWPLAARPQPSSIRPLVGVLSPLSMAAAARSAAVFNGNTIFLCQYFRP